MKKFFIWFFSILLALILGFAGYEYFSFQKTWNKIHVPHKIIPIDPLPHTKHPKNNKPSIPKSPSQEKPFSLLLLGIGGYGTINNTDTMMLAVLYPAKKQINLISIPRDLYVNIPGYTDHKINAAYLLGGPNLTIRTVQDYTQIPIDGYMAVNFNGFLDFMNVLGGLNVNVPKLIQFHDRLQHNQLVTLYPGQQHLSPMQTLEFARYRYGPDGTFGRDARDQTVVKDILSQSLSFRNVTKINQILNVVGNNFSTNLTLQQLLSFAGTFHSITGKDVHSTPIIWHLRPGQTLTPHSIQATTGALNGVDYVFLDQSNQQKLDQLLSNWMK